MESFCHISVMREELVRAVLPGPGKLIVDATLGGGGHSVGLLEEGAEVIGFDQDEDARQFALGHVIDAGLEDNFRVIAGNFRHMRVLLAEMGVFEVDGIIADLGVSSWHLDAPERGFSFMQDGELDMRMDRGRGQTAAEVVNTLAETDLANLIYELGEERASRRIAKAIVKARGKKNLETTLELAAVIESVLPRTGRIHPATRTFQALRMYVNQELESIAEMLEDAPGLLKVGGRMAVITFHSLEDRLVKQAFREGSKKELDDPSWPAPRENPHYWCKQITRKPILPTVEEIKNNPRARSAKLRVVERIS